MLLLCPWTVHGEPRRAFSHKREARELLAHTSGNLSDIFTVYGYSVAQTMVAVLKQCGDNLTRENVMKQAASIHDLKLPMLLPGITVSTSADDFAPIKQMQLQKFDGTT
jgi:branched-chain amino acid transport system substrate-binding protein